MRRALLLAAVTLLLLPNLALGLDARTRPVGPRLDWSAADMSRFDAEHVYLKFVEGADVRLAGAGFVAGTAVDLGPVNSLLAANQVLEARQTFAKSRAQTQEWKRLGEMRSGVAGPDLSLWFTLRVGGGREAVAALIDALNALDAVEISHPMPAVEPASIRSPGGAAAVAERDIPTPDFSGQQGYLYNTPIGLDAPAAWATPGGLGENMKFIDVELAWVENHEDFDINRHFYLGGHAEDNAYLDHGTAVLGEVMGQHNGYGVSGFAPAVLYGMVAIDINAYPDCAQYFQEAIDFLDAGDVWLIELQMYPPGASATPMEWLQVNFDVIWTGVFAREVVCVEAGANGSQNLDAPFWGGIFDRNQRDSGAIMVGAGTPTGRVAEYFTNYGSRMDVHAWGSQIVTTGYGDLYSGGTLQTEYTGGFGGTSGASPMVVGASLCLQGISKFYTGATLDPIALRALLHDTGIPHLDGVKEIGPRPDLGAAVLQVTDLSSTQEFQRGGELLVLAATNPFRGEARIRFVQPADGASRLSIYDTRGRRLRAMQSPSGSAGDRLLVWDGRDREGARMPAGVYLYRIESGERSATGKLVRID